MSTKNLARTIIEGGRTTRSKDARRQCTRFARQQARMYITRGLKDPDHFDDFNEFDYREWDVHEQRDKLPPVYRWLDKHSGQPWDLVWSKLKGKFDNRNVAQRHVIYDHMLHEVTGNGVTREVMYRYWYRREGFNPEEMHVDKDGILRGHTRYGRYYYNRRKAIKPRYTGQQVSAWAGDNKVIVRGPGVYFWVEPVESSLSAVAAAEYRRRTGFEPPSYAYRQTTKLTKKDAEIFEHLMQLPDYLNYKKMLLYPTPHKRVVYAG
jgi:hypothetical protein